MHTLIVASILTSLQIQALPLERGPIPRGAQRVSLMALALKAGCEGDARVDSLHVHLLGLGDTNLIDGVYLLRGYERLTRAARVSSADQTVLLRPRSLVIGACETQRLEIAADFSADVPVGSEFHVEVQSAGDMEVRGARVEGRFPLRSDEGGTITPLPSGTLTVAFLPLSGTIQPVTEETLAKFQVEADGQAHQLLQSVTLTNEGTAKGDEVRNLFLTRNQGKALTNTAPQLQGNEVTLTFLQPFFVRKGQSVVFELRGRAFRRVKTIRFLLKEPSDLHALSTRRPPK